MSTIVHISDCSDDGSSGGVFDALADPEISDLDLSLGVEQYVLRLDVAMDGMPHIVDIVQSVQDLTNARTTLKMIAAISSSDRTSFFAATSWITFLSAPMSMYSITCFTSPSWKKQV